MRLRLLPLALAGMLLTGCGGGGSTPQAAPAPTAAPATTPSPAPSCPASASNARWPSPVPADLPLPPTAAMGGTEKTNGLTLVRFSTKQSVRDGVVFLASRLQPAGYTIGRGDAEAVEADVPFTKGALRGLMKMVAQAPCQTQWVLALQLPGDVPVAPGAPLLQPRTSASPSPLPFG